MTTLLAPESNPRIRTRSASGTVVRATAARWLSLGRRREWTGLAAGLILLHSFIRKASVVWYWHGGRWLELAGAD